MKLYRSVAVSAFASLLCYSHVSGAAPLPDDTLLALETGANPDASGRCTTGSCFGMEVSPGFHIWTMVSPGADGGFIVGRNQVCGGQEGAPSGTNTTPGDITAAWFFFGAYGTICANNELNIFSDTSNDDMTMINDLNVAWNGSSIPMGGGNVNDYIITIDGENPEWSMNYSILVPSGAFVGVPFTLITRGSVTLPPSEPVNLPPIVNDLSMTALTGELTHWVPDFTDANAGDTHNCAITANASNGNATVNPDCTAGTYTSGLGYVGQDYFMYTVTDQLGLSATANVTVNVEWYCGVVVACSPVCVDEFPLTQVTTVGGGQSPTVNASLQTTFTGHITTQSGLISGGKNAVKICPGTTVDFTASSSVGNATCIINSAATASFGTMAIGDKLICTNKPDASDTDRFSIKSGL